MKLVECVPNFSEGRNPDVIEAIAEALRSVSGAELLDVDPGSATNRTVYTLIGTPDAVVDAAFAGIARALEVIDMSQHTGEHARQGACDVCPFVPVSGVTMDDCVELAHRLAKRVGEELELPVYLYARAAQRPERVRLPTIRVGEYEALPDKLGKPEWEPDYGPARFDPRFGVLTTGARPFLIAYNVNVNTKDKAKAHYIAARVREKGYAKRDENFEFVRNAKGKGELIPGRFPGVQGVGWVIEEYGRAQCSFNITDATQVGLHEVFEACREFSHGQPGVRVTGAPAREKNAALVTDTVAVGVAQEERMRRLLNNRAVLVRKDAGRNAELVGEEREPVSTPVTVRVFEYADAVESRALPFDLVRIVLRLLDIGVGREKSDLEALGNDHVFHRLCGTDRKLHAVEW